MPETSPATAKQQEQQTMWMALGVVWELGYIIALPALAFGFVGAYADKHYGTTPMFVLIGLLLSFVLSGYAVYRRIKRITSRL